MSTPTKEETLAAIDGSIAHWKRHATGTAEPWEGTRSSDCELCGLFLNGPHYNCEGCPLFEFTGKTQCGHDTWVMADDAYYEESPVKFKDAARGMVDLLNDARAWFLEDPKTRTATFERFEITMPVEAAKDCSHSGQCDADVDAWEDKIARPPQCTPEKLAAELSEHGAWDEDELKDDAENWRRIIWIAAGNIQEEKLYDPERYKNLPVLTPEPTKP